MNKLAGEVRDDLVLMGFIGKPHGVRGDVKVVPETDDPARFEEFDHVFLALDGARRLFDVERVRLQASARGVIPVLSLKGVVGRDEAEALRGAGVYVEEDELELEEDEFFLHDLIGLKAVDEEGQVIGRVTDVLSLPAGPVLVVTRDGAGDALIPAVGEFLVDITADAVVIRVIEGLLDD